MFARKKNCLLLSGALLLFGFLFLAVVPCTVRCQEDKSKGLCADKELCALMLRAGKEAFERGKYIEARSFFKKAIQADANVEKAWRWYNITLSYALAEQSRTILYPDIAPSTAPEQKEPESDIEFKIMGEDAESC